MIYVYALTDPVEPPQALRGLGGAPLRSLDVNGVAGVYSALDGPAPQPTAEVLWEHEAVAEGLMPHGAVLPTRFGTALGGPARLERLLERNAIAVADALDRVRGLVEIGLRITIDEPGPAAPAPAGSASSSGRDYLMRRVAADRRRRASGAQAAARAAAIHEPLAARAQGAVGPDPDGAQGLRAAYLVAPDAVEGFVGEARALDAAHPDLRVLCTGPWPAHSFAPHLDLGERGDG